MQLLENMYSTVILNEKLKVVNLTTNKIKAVLDDEYAKWRQRYGPVPAHIQKQYNTHVDDIDTIAKIIPALYAYDKRYTEIFRTADIDVIKIQLAATDMNWRNFLQNHMPRRFTHKQPTYLALIRLIKELGLIVPISRTTNPNTGKPTEYPVYPLHLLNKYIQMNILEKEFNMPEDLKHKIEDVIFDDQTKQQIQTDIEAYNSRNKKGSN